MVARVVDRKVFVDRADAKSRAGAVQLYQRRDRVTPSPQRIVTSCKRVAVVLPSSSKLLCHKGYGEAENGRFNLTAFCKSVIARPIKVLRSALWN